MVIEIPQQKGSTSGKHFADCRIQEVQAAIKYAELPTDNPVPPEDLALLERVRKALQEVPSHNPMIVVTARPDPRQEMAVTIKLPSTHFETLRDALDIAFPKSDDAARVSAPARAGPSPAKKSSGRNFRKTTRTTLLKGASKRSTSQRGGFTLPRPTSRRNRPGARRR